MTRNDECGDGDGARLPSAERFRERAKSVATLLATAAGALIAGLVFSPATADLSPAALIAGFVALFGLVAGCGLFVAASLHFRLESTGPVDATVKSVIGRIRLLSRLGAVFAGLAGLCAVALLPLNMFLPAEKMEVQVALSGTDAVARCEGLRQPFSARVAPGALKGTDTYLRLEILSEECGGKGGGTVAIYVRRESVSIVTDQRQGR